MARIKVRAAYAFNNIPKGMEGWIEDDHTARGYIARGALVVIEREPKRKPKGEAVGDGPSGPELG